LQVTANTANTAYRTIRVDNCDLEALGDAAKRNRWIFLVSAAPIPVGGGTGSPLNPIATL
jgi:hypothetical protein